MKKEFFQVRADDELLQAIDEASRGRAFRADWTRDALRTVLGMNNPELRKKTAELMKKHPRMHLLGLDRSGARVLYDQALEHGIDADWHPAAAGDVPKAARSR